MADEQNHNEHRDEPHAPQTSLWPLGFAIGVACILVGLIVSFAAIVVGAILALVFGFLWVRELAHWGGPDAYAAAKEAAAARAATSRRTTAAASSPRAWSGIGAAIGAGVTLPLVGFMVLPSFVGDAVKTKKVDLGPIANFPEGRIRRRDVHGGSRAGRGQPPDRLRPEQRIREQRSAELHRHLQPLRPPRVPGAAERLARRRARSRATRTSR